MENKQTVTPEEKPRDNNKPLATKAIREEVARMTGAEPARREF